MRTFLDAFPNGSVWNSDATGKGYDVVLLGRVEPTSIDLAAAQRRIAENPLLARSAGEVNLGSALDLFSSYAVGAQDLGPWLADTPVNTDFSLKLEYISGLAYNLQQADAIYTSMVRARRYPEGLFIGAPEIEMQLRERITGVPASSPTASP
jgi:hypothetical protein